MYYTADVHTCAECGITASHPRDLKVRGADFVCVDSPQCLRWQQLRLPLPPPPPVASPGGVFLPEWRAIDLEALAEKQRMRLDELRIRQRQKERLRRLRN